LDARPTIEQAMDIAERWRPWRGSAALLLWHYYKKAPA
jgi:DNA-3-methyladenine glycosylase II